MDPLIARLSHVSVSELLARQSRQRRLVRPRLRPVHAGVETVAYGTEGRDLRWEQTGLGDLADLHVLRVSLLGGLAPEGGEVRRNGKGVEDLAVLPYELLDLCRVVVGAVLVSACVDDRVARAFVQRSTRLNSSHQI